MPEGMKQPNLSDIKCFKCMGMGHHQFDCTKELVCYKCKQKGHMAVDCSARKL